MEDMDEYGYIEDEPVEEDSIDEESEEGAIDEPAHAKESDDDFELDEVKGSHGRKPKMALLNKKKVGSYEMDELFLDF